MRAHYLAVGMAAGLLTMAACTSASSGGQGSSSTSAPSGPQGSPAASGPAGLPGSSVSSGPPAGDLVSGGSITVAVASDPINLDPSVTLDSGSLQFHYMAYDTLLSLSPQGKLVPNLATAWSTKGNSYVFTIKPGVTCSDATAMNAKVIGENISYTLDPKNKSPMLGYTVPADTKVTADVAANTVTLTAPTHDAFFLNHIANLFMICQKGLDNRGLLKTQTFGSGPYVLGDRVPKSHYTYSVRTGYTWGPDGTKTDVPGQPAKVNFQIVASETTVANLLLNKQVNIGFVKGPDRARLTAAKLFNQVATVPQGEFFFNQKSGSIISDLQVRKALMMAVDMDQLRNVFSQGNGAAPTSFLGFGPTPCPNAGAVAKNSPQHDVAAAKALLDTDGWIVGSDGLRSKAGKPLSLTLIYDTATQPQAAASEFAVDQWKAIGVQVKPVATDVINDGLFGSHPWDMAWQGVGPADPATLVQFFSGKTPPAGNNFGSTNNPAYVKLTDAAQKMDGAAGCDLWNQAEASLLSNVDTLPFSFEKDPTWGNGVQFESTVYSYFPTSLRQTK
ncbi:peptide/nickel transport system substrate-binding protein [Nakamurella sp. UYEF19]|uniref:ABC transporter substrate-binding protein n=1 Tax=Nakamurella sp. UYEF19 TaxID=1756392 RepID=UPI00339340FF